MDYVVFFERMYRQLGSEKVLNQPAAQARYGPCTTGVRRIIPGAICPASQQEVIQAVTASRELNVPLYPISTGNNWGYGSANPVIDGCVIVDLSSMKSITIDGATGLATLEPGVTQGALRAYLDDNDLKFLCPVTGAGPDCSLIGNALERGYGITPHTDHFLSVMSLEVVLPDGRLYKPPLAELGCQEADKAFKWGVGPFLDGIFSQGAFGIVTRMTIALAPVPERVEAFFFGLPFDSDLESGVEAIRALLREVSGVVGSVNLMNMRRVLSMMEPYPHDEIGKDGLINEKYVLEMARRNRIMPWMGTGAIYGNARVVRAVKSVVGDKLSRVGKRLIFFTPQSAHRLNRLSRLVPGRAGHSLKKIFNTLDKTLQLLAGTPSDIALPLAYWVFRGKTGTWGVSKSCR